MNGSRVNITYIISDIDKALSFEWLAQYINKDGFKLSFILLNPGPSFLAEYLIANGFEVDTIQCRGKQDWPSAFWKTYRKLKQQKPDVVHCHLIQANIIGLSAAKLAGVKKRIYTRHHSSLHHVYFPKGVWWDRLTNKLATDIIAISGIVKKILLEWEKVPEQKVHLIPHGFLLDEFLDVDNMAIEEFRERNQLKSRFPVIGVISRFTEWKGVQYIIPAFQQLLTTHPESVLLLLNAHGDYENSILNQLEALPKNSVRLIKFEKNIAAAYKSMDIFVHVPIDEHSEAFGQIYIEALAAGVPSVFTRSGIANESYFNSDVVTIVDYKNSKQITEAILNNLNKNAVATQLDLGRDVAKKFDLPSYINQIESLYLQR